MPWTGAFKLSDYLNRSGGVPDSELPPEAPGVYILTGKNWSGAPTGSVDPLYVGRSGILRNRLGDLISSLCGFHGIFSGRHSGGITVNTDHIRTSDVSPFDLFIGWLSLPALSPKDIADKERALIEQLKPRHNKK